VRVLLERFFSDIFSNQHKIKEIRYAEKLGVGEGKGFGAHQNNMQQYMSSGRIKK
jgi:hypothetical protein